MTIRRKLVPKSENRRQKFERLLVTRMNKALHSIRLLGNLSSQNYKHTPGDAHLIRAALESELASAVSKFHPKPQAERKDFILTSNRIHHLNGGYGSEQQPGVPRC